MSKRELRWYFIVDPRKRQDSGWRFKFEIGKKPFLVKEWEDYNNQELKDRYKKEMRQLGFQFLLSIVSILFVMPAVLYILIENYIDYHWAYSLVFSLSVGVVLFMGFIRYWSQPSDYMIEAKEELRERGLLDDDDGRLKDADNA